MFWHQLGTKTRLARREASSSYSLFLAAESVYAEWVKVASTGDITIYVDPDTIRRKGDLVKMGKLLDYETV